MQFTTRHRAAIRKIVEGKTNKVVAQELGVKPVTIGNWLKDPDFKAAIEELEHQTTQRLIELQAGAAPRDDFSTQRQKINQHVGDAVDVLIKTLHCNDESQARQAALMLLKFGGFDPNERQPDVTMSIPADYAEQLCVALNEANQMRKVDRLKARHAELQQQRPAPPEPASDALDAAPGD